MQYPSNSKIEISPIISDFELCGHKIPIRNETVVVEASERTVIRTLHQLFFRPLIILGA